MVDIYKEPIEDRERIEEAERVEEVEKVEKGVPLEEEILELERRIEQKKKELEKVKKLGKTLEKIGEKAPPTLPPAISREEELTEEEKLSLKKIKTLSREKQLETLIEISLWKGLAPAVKIARALNNAYILDEFHDTLVDKLYQELISRGQLKEE